MAEEDRMRGAVLEFMDGLIAARCVIAAGRADGDVDAFAQMITGVLIETVQTLTVARGCTPRTILDRLFTSVTPDDEWRETKLAALGGKGQRHFGRGRWYG